MSIPPDVSWFALDFLNEGAQAVPAVYWRIQLFDLLVSVVFCVKKWWTRHLFIFFFLFNTQSGDYFFYFACASSSIGVLFVPRYDKKAAHFVWCAIQINLFDYCLAGGSSCVLWSSRLWCPSTRGDKLTTLFNLLLICWPKKMCCPVIPVCFFLQQVLLVQAWNFLRWLPKVGRQLEQVVGQSRKPLAFIN